MRSRLALLATAALGLASILAVSPAGAGTGRPDSIVEPPQDGCGRDPLGLLAGTSPEWVYIHGDPAPRRLAGRVVVSRPAETDLFSQHDSYDMNAYVDPDASHEDLLGTADPSSMEVEWEESAWALFAWPSLLDTVDVMGSWIWDCGHWGPADYTDPRYFAPGTQAGEVVTGESAEIHPPRMVVVHRATPSTSRRGEAVADVLISSHGTLARGIEDQAAGICPGPLASCPTWTPVNDRNYAFTIRAPAKPPGATHVTWRSIDRGSVNAPGPQVSVLADRIRVVVPFRGWGTDGDEMVFARSFLVGWDVRPAVHHYRVTLRSLTWVSELDGPDPSVICVPQEPCTGNPQQSAPPDEANVYVDVAGQWRQLDLPGLLTVAPGDTFSLADRFDVYLVGSPGWRILGRGRECDQPKTRECPVPQELGFNDDAGIFEDVYQGGSGIGRHTGEARSQACTNSSDGPCFTLAYRIQDLGVVGREQVPATPTTPAGTGGGDGDSGATLPATGGPVVWWMLGGVVLIAASYALRRAIR